MSTSHRTCRPLATRLCALARLTVVVGLTGVLPACATIDSIVGLGDADVAVPAQWSNALAADAAGAEAADLSTWWERFDDPVLGRLIARALERSPDLRTSLSRITQARAALGLTVADQQPTVDVGVSASGNRVRDLDTHSTDRNESYGSTLDAQWQIDLFGKLGAEERAATATLAETTENYRASQVSLAAEVATTYVSLRSLQTQLAVAQQNVTVLEEIVQLTQWREQAGVGDALGTEQSLTSLERTRATLPALRENIATTENALALLLGDMPGTIDELLGAASSMPAASTPPQLAIPANTLEQRPDLRAARYAVEAAVASTESARLERLPTLTVAGALGFQGDGLVNVVSPETMLMSLVASLSAPVLDADRIEHNVRIQNESARQALIAYEHAARTAIAEVENALIALRENAVAQRHLVVATEHADETVRLSQLQYEAGEVDLFVVLDAQSTLYVLRDQLVTSAAAEVTAQIQLYKALGGGWSAALPATGDSRQP